MPPTAEELASIFQRLKGLLAKYEGPLTPRSDTERSYDLWSEKDVVFAGRKRQGAFFAGLIIQSSYVGFYYMPVYLEPEVKALFPERLLKLLKGKSCFHIKRLDDELEAQVAQALADGYRMYQERGWV